MLFDSGELVEIGVDSITTEKGDILRTARPNAALSFWATPTYLMYYRVLRQFNRLMRRIKLGDRCLYGHIHTLWR